MASAFMIRTITPDDAEGLLALSYRIAAEPDNGVLFTAGEFSMTLEQQRALIEKRLASEDRIIIPLVAVDESNTVIGQLTASGGTRRATRGTVGFGVFVDAAWRDQGVGTALVRELIARARQHPEIHRVYLDVFTHNVRAIHVYEKLGFVREGVRRRAYFKDGRFVDALVMAMIV
jgi:RimJ/RimL family protein N-acetyltransferase